MHTIIAAVRRRPVRVVEALVALAAAIGLVVAPELEQAIAGLVVAAVALVGGEVAQTQTTPTADPSLDHEVPDEVASTPDQQGL